MNNKPFIEIQHESHLTKKVRVGNWVQVRFLLTGELEWFWDPKNNPEKLTVVEDVDSGFKKFSTGKKI